MYVVSGNSLNCRILSRHLEFRRFLAPVPVPACVGGTCCFLSLATDYFVHARDNAAISVLNRILLDMAISRDRISILNCALRYVSHLGNTVTSLH